MWLLSFISQLPVSDGPIVWYNFIFCALKKKISISEKCQCDFHSVWDVTLSTCVLGQRFTENPDKDCSGAKRQQRPIAAIHQSQAVSNSLCSVWPSSDVTAVVLTASGRPLVTGRPPGLVHLVPHQQWPWNSIRWPHTPLHKQVRAHTHSLQLTLINGPDIQRVTHSQSGAAEALLSFYITVVWKRLTSSLLARKKRNKNKPHVRGSGSSASSVCHHHATKQTPSSSAKPR